MRGSSIRVSSSGFRPVTGRSGSGRVGGRHRKEEEVGLGSGQRGKPEVGRVRKCQDPGLSL